jgi:hypothetical protein
MMKIGLTKRAETGDPLSPLLFNLVVDVFTKMLSKASTKGLNGGLLTNMIERGIVSLQYTDDTILFLKNDLDQANHFEWLMTCFENLSGTRINYNKSDFITMGVSENVALARLFCCNIGFFHQILGVPIHFTKLSREIFNLQWISF